MWLEDHPEPVPLDRRDRVEVSGHLRRVMGIAVEYDHPGYGGPQFEAPPDPAETRHPTDCVRQVVTQFGQESQHAARVTGRVQSGSAHGHPRRTEPPSQPERDLRRSGNDFGDPPFGIRRRTVSGSSGQPGQPAAPRIVDPHHHRSLHTVDDGAESSLEMLLGAVVVYVVRVHVGHHQTKELEVCEGTEGLVGLEHQ